MEETKWQKTVAWVRHTGLYIQALVKWLLVALVVGVACGALGSAFHIGVERATELRGEHPWLLWCLPPAGLLIVGFYRLTRTEGQGTNDIIDAVHLGKGLTLKLLPAIFFGTVLTHLCGGSAGREGAALQMGGTIGHKVGAWFRLDDRDMRTATMAGMAAFFSALFGTPLTATVFAMVVISIGVMYHAAFIPCFAASLTAYGVSRLMGVAPTAFTVEAPALELSYGSTSQLLAEGTAVGGGRLGAYTFSPSGRAGLTYDPQLEEEIDLQIQVPITATAARPWLSAPAIYHLEGAWTDESGGSGAVHVGWEADYLLGTSGWLHLIEPTPGARQFTITLTAPSGEEIFFTVTLPEEVPPL